MCGIAGFIDRDSGDLEAVCRRMTGALSHRGPDDSGHWVDREAAVALGHRRLSIIDLSPAGHQPMRSAGGRYELVYNGEIYNHTAIRQALGGHAPAWRGHSDSETLLAAIEAWGIEAALTRCVGMFALAVWDRQNRRLTLARDRTGEKPLYYGRHGRAFLFGSELKALQAHPAFHADIDRESLTLYLRYCYVPDPRSIFRGVAKLLPGTLLHVDENGNYGDPVPYWSAAEVIAKSRAQPFTGTDAEAIDKLEQVLGEAVGAQMASDVPLGAFLSGGVDSSLIVALMQKRSSQRIRTFTIGFAESAYDESRYARAVAKHLGTDHTELLVTPAQTIQAIPRMPLIYDEPFGDSSQIPTFLVSELARQHVTVSLSGDAGDELFGGYNRYAFARYLWDQLSRVPKPMRGWVARGIRARSPASWTRILDVAKPLIPRRWRAAQMGDKLHKLADFIGSSPEEVYGGLVSHWPAPDQVVVGAKEPLSRLREIMAQPSELVFEENMMYWDLMTYLPGDILVKVDRAAMAVSLESRVPMLDHRVIEFAWTLPLHMRVRGGEGKWLMKQLLSRHVPRALTDRPKTGFGIPIDVWLRGPLRDWAESLLDESRLRREGFFDPVPIRAKWREHLGETRNWAYWLWDILMFQAWWQAQCERRTMPATSGEAELRRVV
jgi:asparagine synthase (glutamine-hydrolysing)